MATLSFKVSAEEARLIRNHARAESASVSAYLRKRALGTAIERKVVLAKSPISGLTVDVGPGAAVNQAEIDAALADFP